MFRIRQIDHVVLRVIDLERMLRFYIDVLGCTPEKDQVEIGLYQVRAGSSLVDLVPVEGKLGRAGGRAPASDGRNLDHLCLSIEPFIPEEIFAHLAKHGVVGGPVESRYGAQGEGPSIYVTDPEGNIVELKGAPFPKADN
jgi:catechol 2,3-dioxygenase-like lactoylglutathione lyase family enzyme